jgi:hypothetical protein
VEFVAAHGFSLASAVDSLTDASIAWSAGGFRLQKFGGIELFASDPLRLNAAAMSQPEPDRAAFYLFDGQFSAGTHYFHTLLKAPAGALRRRIDTLLRDEHGGDDINAGQFVVGRIQDGRLELLTDSLSQYPVYYFRSGERFVISNVLRQIAAVLSASGLPTTPSLLPCLEGTVFGGVLADSTHFAEIKRLPFGHGIIADPYLQLRRLKSTDRELSYEETIGRARSALAQHVRAVADAVAAPRLIAADITGGGDSRLVLSLLLDSPLRGEIRGRCFTRYPHPDANVAGALMTAYNLPVAEFPVVVDEDPRFWQQRRMRREIEANAALTGGARLIAGTLSTIAFPNFVHFTGLFGELGGATVTGDFVGEAEQLGYSAARAVDLRFAERRRIGALDLISEEGLAIVRNNAIAALTELEEEGITREHLQAELYLRSRCRTHFGLVSWLANQSKIAPEPLACPWLVEARRLLPRRLYRRQKVILDLILAGGCKDLALVPMASKIWHESIVPPAELETLGRVEPVTAATPPLSPLTGSLMGARTFVSDSTRQLMLDPVVRKEIQARGSNRSPSGGGQTRFGNERAIESSQALMREALDRIPARDDIWSLLNRDEAIRYAHQAKEEFQSSVDVGALSQVISGISWMLDQPTPSGIRERRDSTNAKVRFPEPAEPVFLCNICGGTTFREGPNHRLSTTNLPPMCAKCGSLERHRVFRALFNGFRTVQFRSMSCLMFSKDSSVAGGWFRSMRYSIYGTESSLDVQDIALPDGAFDVVICNHILEHVPRYEAGLAEICRIMSPTGFAFVSFPNPHHREVTLDWGHPKPEMHGHYRIFGSDIEAKLPLLLPGIGILRLVGRDPVTGTEDRAYIFSKNQEFLNKITDRGMTYQFLGVEASS